MGFKRTTEGRVFFQTGQEGEGQQPANSQKATDGNSLGQAMPYNPPNISAPNQMQVQILGLLKSLNERLRATQADRDYLRSELETYKGLVHDLKRRAENLEDKVSTGAPAKSDKTEKIAAEAMKELAETRKVLAELEEKTDKTESDLKRQVAQIKQNETTIRQKQAELEQLQQAHQAEISRRIEDRSRELSVSNGKQWEQLMSRIEKRDEAISLRISNTEDQAKTAADKVEEAISNTSKLDRKVEKALQDRTRLIRKLERIEETVIQTHDALNARAMVLLTDQNTASQGHFPYKSALADGTPVQGFVEGDEEQQAQNSVASPVTSAIWWKKPVRLGAPAMTGIVVVALLSGWFISQAQRPDIGSFELPPIVTEDVSETPVPSSAPEGGAEAFLEPDSAQDLSEPVAPPVDVQDQSFEQTMNKFIESGTGAVPDDIAAKDDLGTQALTEQDKVLALLEDNPDAVAAKLNEIEPTSLPPTEEEKMAEAVAAPVPAPVVQDAPAAPKEPVKSISSAELAKRVKPDPNLPSVVKEIEAKAFEGVPEAQHDLAAIYTAGHGGVTQDYKKAATWFEIAADAGVANAAYNLGVLYHQGIGVKKNLDTALSWYQKAADQGHPEAQYNLGIAHIEGVGLPYDAQKAARYFENAAREGVMEAAYNLGLIYENGLLGDARPDEALMWYKAAADKGSPEAKAALDHLAKSLDIRLEDVNKLVDGMKTLKAPAASESAPAAPVEQEESSAVPLDPGPSPERSLTAGIQEQLMSFGLYPGPADGLNGPLTEDSIRSYQNAYGLEADGKVTQSLLTHMMGQSMKAMTDGFVGTAGNQ